MLFARRDGPRSPRWPSAPVLSPANRRAALWEGRGATARPREAKWSSGVAGVLGYIITIITFTTEEHYIMWI